MMEMKIKIEVPDLAAAIDRLAAAVTKPAVAAPESTAQALPPVATTPQPAAPIATTPAATTPPPMPAPATGPAPMMPQTPGPAAPAQTAAPAMPVTTAPAYTLDQISKAGAALVDAGKMDNLLALLAKYGIQAITQLQPAQYGVFATEMRALGAQI